MYVCVCVCVCSLSIYQSIYLCVYVCMLVGWLVGVLCHFNPCWLFNKQILFAQSAGAVEYTDCTSAEG